MIGSTGTANLQVLFCVRCFSGRGEGVRGLFDLSGLGEGVRGNFGARCFSPRGEGVCGPFEAFSFSGRGERVRGSFGACGFSGRGEGVLGDFVARCFSGWGEGVIGPFRNFLSRGDVNGGVRGPTRSLDSAENGFEFFCKCFSAKISL